MALHRYRFDAPLIPGRLLRRYKRFLVDVELGDGRRVTAHTPNTGSMRGCSEPGSAVYISRATRPGRKLDYTLQMIRVGRIWVGVNTLLPNALVHDAACRDAIPELAGYAAARREVKISDSSRIDLVLTPAGDGAPCYVEIKNVTLVDGRTARFPDAQTERGRKHLRELERLAQEGSRAVIFFLIQRADCDRFQPADDIDPDYGRLLRRAAGGGVEALAYRARARRDGIRLEVRVPVLL